MEQKQHQDKLDGKADQLNVQAKETDADIDLSFENEERESKLDLNQHQSEENANIEWKQVVESIRQTEDTVKDKENLNVQASIDQERENNGVYANDSQ